MRSWLSAALLAAVVASSGLYACSSASNGAAPPPAADSGDVGDGGSSETAAPSPLPGRVCPDKSPLTYQSFGQPFFSSWCTGCHSSALGSDLRRGAPPDVNFDTLAMIRARLPAVYARAGDDHTTMPPAGGPPADLRHQLGDWLACGAPGDEVTFDVVPSDAGGPPLPTGPCAAKHEPLPPSSLPRCAAATYACMQACKSKGPDSDACSKQCTASDPTAPDPATGANCASCLSTQLLACADRACHGPLAEYFCCVTDAGASGCVSEQTDLGVCVYYASPTCLYTEGPDQAACFPADAGIDGGY